MRVYYREDKLVETVSFEAFIRQGDKSAFSGKKRNARFRLVRATRWLAMTLTSPVSGCLTA